VTIHARGRTKLPRSPGNVILSAGDLMTGGLVSLRTGNGWIEVESRLAPGSGPTGHIRMLHTANGSIVIRQGKDLLGNPTIELKKGAADRSVQLSCGLPQAGAQITLKDAELSLGWGPALGPSIVMNSTGMTLKVGTNRISLTADAISFNGVNVRMEALAQLQLQAVALDRATTALEKATAALESHT
ncbi:MAG: hypothetical protein AB7K24_34600, partial [Gemmataceae bacterium]